MGPIVAAAGLAEASLLDQWLFVAFTSGSCVLGVLALLIGIVIAARAELPPEDYGEQKQCGWIDEI